MSRDRKKVTDKEVKLRQVSRLAMDLKDVLLMSDQAFMSSLDDRSIAILHAAHIDRAMEHALIFKMRPLTAQQKKELFEGPVMGNFSAKIKIGYAFGIFGERVRAELEEIRNIRNQFSHATIIINFETKQIKDACNRLKFVDKMKRPHPQQYSLDKAWPPTDPRIRYTITAAELTSYFGLMRVSPELKEQFGMVAQIPLGK